MKFLRALLGTTVAAVAVVTFQTALAPSAAAQDTALCVACWCIVEP